MGLNLENMDVEPAAPTDEAPVETPTEPSAAPPPPIAEAPPAAAPAAPEPPPEPKHEVIPLARYLEDKKALQARIAELEAKTAPAKPAEAAPVDFMEDPKGYVDQTVKGAVSKAAALETELQSLREQQQINALVNEAGQAEAAFAKEHADYQAALDHVRSTRMAQLRLMDNEATEAQLQQVIAREEIMGIAAAKQRGINPAELAYNYAKTLGYRTPEAPKPAPAAPVAAPATLAAAAADVSAARSLGAGGGGGDTGGDEEESEITSALKARFRR
jgi:hypothetical protein